MFHHPLGYLALYTETKVASLFCLWSQSRNQAVPAGPPSWHRHVTLTDGTVISWHLPKVFRAIGLPHGAAMQGRS